MKVKTFSLSGTALDWAVAKCEGMEFDLAPDGYYIYKPSSNWAMGGPIIEKQEIALEPMTDSDYGDGWLATRVEHPAVCMEFGPTMLVAAMRCYVLSQLGDAIEVPDELCETTMEITE